MLKTSLVLLTVLLATSTAFNLDEFHYEPKIVQGTNATRGQFKYYAFLKIRMAQGTAACGGSLISKKWVVTAAHCLDGASSVEVHLGALKAKDVFEVGRVILNVTKKDLYIHPRYIDAIVWK